MPSLKDCDKVLNFDLLIIIKLNLKIFYLNKKLFFKLAIYHGLETVSQDRISNYVDYSSLKWFQTIDFNVQVRNLHRCAKLCIALYCQSKRKKVCSLFLIISFYSFIFNERNHFLLVL